MSGGQGSHIDERNWLTADLEKAITKPSEHLQPVTEGRLGFFTSPSLVMKGPLKGKIVKVYKGIRSAALCRRVISIHASYVQHLRKAGIRVPPTDIEILKRERKNALVVVQDAFSSEELVRGIMSRAPAQPCLDLLTLLLQDAFRMIGYMTSHPQLNIGFHPTLRNYALRDGQLSYFDTFPPMIAVTRSQLEWIIMRFAPYRVPGFFLPLCKPFMGHVTHEYYDPPAMLTGLVGSACRLRPELAKAFLATAMTVIDDHASRFPGVASAANDRLARPPKLSLLWVVSRKIFGKDGAPNL